MRLVTAATPPLLCLVAACAGDDDAASTTEGAATVSTLAAATSTAATTTATTTTPATTTTTTTTAPPVEFVPPEGDYAITFPGQPRALNQAAPLPDGTTLPYVIYSYQLEVEGDSRELGVSSVAYPPATLIHLDAVRDGAVAAFPGAHLISSEPIELQGRPGLQFSVDLAPGGTPSYYMSRVYTDGTKLYQVFYVGGTISPSDAHVAAFFDSFRLPEGG